MYFEAMDLEHWIWSPIQWTVPVSRLIWNKR